MHKRYRWVLCLLALLLLGQQVPAQSLQYDPAQQVQRLRLAIKKYEGLVAQQKWTVFKEKVCLQAGETDACNVNLRESLRGTGDLASTASPADSSFNEQLRQAVMRFQRRHGLETDGVVGLQTLEALNVSPNQRLQQLQINLRRWEADSANRKLPLVLVNIPDYTLHLLDSTGGTMWQTPVVVGQTKGNFQTVPLESKIGYLVINPTWTVPQSILQREILPMLKADPLYLQRNQMQLFKVVGNSRVLLPLQNLNPHLLDPTKEKLLVVQSPGPHNALGQVKFMFANPYDIYLHDTPAKSLFAHRNRAYSHGCVRVQNPLLLASYLMHQNLVMGQNPPLLPKTSTPEKIMFLPTPVAVKLAYYTCWVDDAGEIQFRKDIYQLDKNLSENYVL